MTADLISDELSSAYGKSTPDNLRLHCSNEVFYLDKSIFFAIAKLAKECLCWKSDIDYDLWLDDFKVDTVKNVLSILYFGKTSILRSTEEMIEVNALFKACGINIDLEKEELDCDRDTGTDVYVVEDCAMLDSDAPQSDQEFSELDFNPQVIHYDSYFKY